MASDPQGRHPTGVLVRPEPDFFDDNMGVGGASQIAFPASNNTYFRVALFNNASTGYALKVYGIFSASYGGLGLGAYFAVGSVDPLLSKCANIRPDLPAPFGEIHGSIITGSVAITNPLLTSPLIGFVGNSGFDSASNFSQFPQFIIPAGYSLVVGNIASSNGAGGAGFWYHQAIE